MKLTRLLLALTCSLLCVCCVEYYDIQVDGHSEIIVIDAMVTDFDKVQTVYIRREKETLYYYDSNNPAFENSSVHIEDDNGWSADFVDVDRGRKFTLTGHKFEPGRTYTITVTVGDRVFVASEKMVPLPDVQGLKFFSKVTKEGGGAYYPILYFKDNQPDVDNYYLFEQDDWSRNYSACNYLPIQILSDKGLREDLDGVVFEVGMGAKWHFDTYIYWKDRYRYSFFTISQSNYDYFGVMSDQIDNDGGVYKPMPSSPQTNFSGSDVQGQFVVASKILFEGVVCEEIVVER